ncbi:hypothetical protein GPECTOR_62g906 [Gonium pectorale]|uniref:Uncharacterized protein n=1 Tax=Gonium pectorale TaxID=33097 RepID=A0A150G4P2_GONPE|nr:hypothetical protein GPECTOR_62g906 [Gonium pectorale]|eukprot:KXZ44791.1 hypothetical protein GPECTOR_62g906 [Gonium pectorale]
MASAPQLVRGFAAAAAGGWRAGSGRGAGPEAEPVDAEVVDHQEAARRVMADPMSRLLASQGMPVGLSMKSPGGAAGGGGGAVSHDDDPLRPPKPEPAYNMEAFSDILRATAASARREPGGAAGADGSAGGDGGFTAGVQTVGPSLDDSWGTTRESPADIARRIAESNAEVRRDHPLAGADSDDDDEEGAPGEGSLSPSEQKYASLEAMSADIKKLDQVFEVLASVPWLDDDVLSEKELKGVARVGLLGTLEEVGFNIRHRLLRIWAGERGAELAAGPGLEFRDQAALLAILYHTQQLEEAHGAPPGGYLPHPGPEPEEEARRG